MLLSPATERSLRLIYQEADAAVEGAGPVCRSSGRCCRFREWGHTLFLSRHEAEFLLEGAPDFEGPVDDSFCPFQMGNVCTAREHRPLGCRVYFCDPGYQNTMQDIMEVGITKLKALATREPAGWEYGPLHRFLQEHLDKKQSETPGDS